MKKQNCLEHLESYLRPEAFISVNKNRQKIHNVDPQNNTRLIYLPNQTEFEIELFNPTSNKVLAKITLNDKKNESGFILKPGERFFLDRHLNEKKKLLFDVYELNTNNKKVQKAIENNGYVKIEFYEEKTYFDYVNIDFIPFCYNDYNSTALSYPNNQYDIYTTNLCNNIDQTNYTISHNASSSFIDKNLCYSRSINVKTEETGRIDKGDVSEQNFKKVDFNSEFTPLLIFEYKLLPISKKPLNSNEMNKQKRYCVGCGKQLIKKGFSYCPGCGRKVE